MLSTGNTKKNKNTKQTTKENRHGACPVCIYSSIEETDIKK